jgi:hypothetical protein
VDSLRRHPVITGLLLSCAVAGAVLGALYLPAEWTLLRRIAAGAFSGAGVGLLCTATRMLG